MHVQVNKKYNFIHVSSQALYPPTERMHGWTHTRQGYCITAAIGTVNTHLFLSRESQYRASSSGEREEARGP